MSGAADWAATIIAVVVGGYLGFRVIAWAADRVIDALDWMTRHE